MCGEWTGWKEGRKAARMEARGYGYILERQTSGLTGRLAMRGKGGKYILIIPKILV